MKTFLTFLSASLLSSSVLACSCYTAKEWLIYELSESKKIDSGDIKFITFKESFRLLPAIPNLIRESLAKDPRRECAISCSLKGTRVVAQVEYLKDGEVCSAKLIKPSYRESRFKLKNLICQQAQ